MRKKGDNMLQLPDPIGDLITAISNFLFLLQVNLVPIVLLIASWIILLILAGLVARFVRRRANRMGIPPSAVNGLVLAIRLIFLWIAIIAITAILPYQLQLWFLNIVGDASIIIGLAIGIAVSLAMRNFVAGIYVMVTNPFEVGDYVRIGTNEGIVLEISLTYTKLRQIDGTTTLIPNDNVMSSAVTNFRFVQKRQLEPETTQQSEDIASIPSRIWKVLSKVVDPSKLIQYSFELRFPISQSIDYYDQKLTPVMKRWTRKFGFKPVYALSSTSHLAFTYTFTIFVENPKLLLEHRSNFIEDISRAIY